MLLIGVMLILSVMMNSIQNHYSKTQFKTNGDNFLYSIIYYAFAVVTTFVLNGCKLGNISGAFLLYGLAYGFTITLTMYCYLQAYRYGSMSVTQLLSMTAIIIPIIPSWLFWGDKITWNQVSGMVFMFAAMYMILNIRANVSKAYTDKRWIGYCIFMVLGSGLAAICEKLFTRSAFAAQKNDFLFMGLASSALAMLVIIFLTRKKQPVTMKLNVKLITPMAISGIAYSVYCLLQLNVLSQLPASVVYTVNNGARLILLTVMDAVLFKTKLTKLQYAGLAIGVVGVVLLSL